MYYLLRHHYFGFYQTASWIIYVCSCRGQYRGESVQRSRDSSSNWCFQSNQPHRQSERGRPLRNSHCLHVVLTPANIAQSCFSSAQVLLIASARLHVPPGVRVRDWNRVCSPSHAWETVKGLLPLQQQCVGRARRTVNNKTRQKTWWWSRPGGDVSLNQGHVRRGEEYTDLKAPVCHCYRSWTGESGHVTAGEQSENISRTSESESMEAQTSFVSIWNSINFGL